MNRWDDYGAMWVESEEEAFLSHHGILGMKWGRRRWQNEDGSLTEAGREHYGYNTLREQNRHSEKNREYDYKMQKSRDSVSKANAVKDIKNKKLEVEKYKSGLNLNKQRDKNSLKKAEIAAKSKRDTEQAKLAELKQRERAELEKLNNKSKLDMAKAKNDYKIAKLQAKTARETMRNEYAMQKLQEQHDYNFDRKQQNYDYVYDRVGQTQEHFDRKKTNASSFVKGLAAAGITAAVLHYGGNYLAKKMANSNVVNQVVSNANPQVVAQGARAISGLLGANSDVIDVTQHTTVR